MTRGNFVIINITDCLEGKIEGFTVADLKEALSEFSSIDPNVASFLKKNAQDFARQHKSVTYLVLSASMTELLRFFYAGNKAHHGESQKDKQDRGASV